MEESAEKLVIHLLSARLTHDTEAFGRMDPYVIVSVGEKTLQSKPHLSGGRAPSWTDVLEFRIIGDEKYIEFTVMDRDYFTDDDCIGEGFLGMKEVKMSKLVDENIQLKYKGRSAGTLHVKVEYISNDASIHKIANDIESEGLGFEKPLKLVQNLGAGNQQTFSDDRINSSNSIGNQLLVDDYSVYPSLNSPKCENPYQEKYLTDVPFEQNCIPKSRFENIQQTPIVNAEFSYLYPPMEAERKKGSSSTSHTVADPVFPPSFEYVEVDKLTSEIETQNDVDLKIERDYSNSLLDPKDPFIDR